MLRLKNLRRLELNNMPRELIEDIQEKEREDCDKIRCITFIDQDLNK